ncbi:MAG: GWxTD domain-containing protein [Gemmatimonadota bacterium]
MTLWAAPALAQSEDAASEGLEVSLHKTWSPGDVTMVDGLANVPLVILSASTTATYRFDLTILDESGSALYEDSWDRELSERAALYVQEGSSLLEPFQFGVMPGSYEVQVRAYPTDAPDMGQSTRLSLEAFSERPVVSDLFLASRVEALEEGAGGGGWSVARGGFGIAASATTRVLPEQPQLFYYLELYADQAEGWTASAGAGVTTLDGRTVYQTPATEVEVLPGGVPFTGKLSLAGLPAGDYMLSMSVDGAGGTIQQTAPFRMLERSALLATRDDSYEARHFASLSEEELEDTYGGIVVLLEEHERQAFESLPPDAQRRYLTDFFGARNPDPFAGANTFLDEYVRRVLTARSRAGASVGIAKRQPWRTDMGRILIRAGEPEDRVINHFPADEGNPLNRGANSFAGEPPYEIWSYRKSDGYVYLFVAEDRFETWRMVYSTDPNANTMPDWTERVGGSALRDLRDNFGIQPRFRTGLDDNTNLQ